MIQGANLMSATSDSKQASLEQERTRLRSALRDLHIASALGDARCGNCWKCLSQETEEATGLPMTSMRLILCPVCGHKRCPHASDHALACTGSNAPGQQGSVYQ